MATCASAFLTATFSPMDTPAFPRIIPSILMIPFLSSSWADLKTFAAVRFFPTISMISPTSMLRDFLVSESMRALPRPTSD